MRSSFGLLLLCLTVSGCRCSPAQPTAVVLRLKNSLGDPLYVDETAGRHGLSLERNVNGDWIPFVETAACPCLACEQVCSCACDLAPPPAQVREVPAGASLERSWSGVVQISSSSACNGFRSDTPCLISDNAPLDETFRLHLCYANTLPLGMKAPDGGTVAGSLSTAALTCVDKDFRPADGAVEVGPIPGLPCTSNAGCGLGSQLCLNGHCTSACPANDFPVQGGPGQLRIQEPDDQGFFTRSPSTSRTVYSGSGAVGSVLYQAGTMTLRLSRPGVGGEVLKGTVYVTLPPGFAFALSQGDLLSVKLIDASSSDNHDNRALVLRDGAGTLLLAVDTAQQGFLLEPTDTAPFRVTLNTDVVGCTQSDCGKQLFSTTRFDDGASPLDLSPGKSAVRVAAGATFQLLNVDNYRYAESSCRLKQLTPYAILRDRGTPGP